jgi:hypothetical protein
MSPYRGSRSGSCSSGVRPFSEAESRLACAGEDSLIESAIDDTVMHAIDDAEIILLCQLKYAGRPQHTLTER